MPYQPMAMAVPISGAPARAPPGNVASKQSSYGQPVLFAVDSQEDPYSDMATIVIEDSPKTDVSEHFYCEALLDMRIKL